MRRNFMLSILILALTSQALAMATVPCVQGGVQTYSNAVTAAGFMDHAGHEVRTPLETMEQRDCCGHDICSNIDCISATAALTDSPPSLVVPILQTLKGELLTSIIRGSDPPSPPAVRRYGLLSGLPAIRGAGRSCISVLTC